VLIKTKDIVQQLGFELVYADTDSVFLKKYGASIKEYENVKEILTREIGLPISIEHHYKFLVLLPLKADERLEALKHYFGITHAGELIARGIELRRHDTPNFIKEFQTEVLHTLFDCENSDEVMSIGYEKALLLVTRTIDRIMTADIQLQDLVVSKLLGQGLDEYKSLFPHVSAAIQLSKTGKSPMVGEGIEYIHTNAHHTNPLCRVKPTDLIRQGEALNYDKEKYREMMIEAAETALGFFGFDRTVYGDTAKKKNGKWWHKFREDRSRDIENETL
jgi:DNA polymerase elongation subunit (family B)